jgi:hypothetical protein
MRKERKRPLSHETTRSAEKHTHTEWVKILEQKSAKEAKFRTILDSKFRLPPSSSGLFSFYRAESVGWIS